VISPYENQQYIFKRARYQKPIMQEIRLKIKKRAFPSQGRVRLNIAIVPELEIIDGDHVDLINEATKKSVTVTVIADNTAGEKQIKVSAEDLISIGLEENDDVLIRKTPLFRDKIKRAAGDADKSLSKGIADIDAKVKKTREEVTSSAAKTAEAVKKETKKASDEVGKSAAKTVTVVKKAVRDATRPHDEL